MGVFGLNAIWLAFACAKRELRHEAPPPVPPPAVAPRPSLNPPPPNYQGTRGYEGSGPLRRPTIQWSVFLDGPIIWPLSVWDQHVLAVSAGSVMAFDLLGKKTWEAPLNANGPISVFGNQAHIPSSGLITLDPDTGTVVQGTMRPSAQPRPVGWAAPMAGAAAWLDETGTVHHQTTFKAAKADGLASDGDRAYLTSTAGELIKIGPDGVEWRVGLPGPGKGRPVIYGDRVFATFSATSQPGGLAAFSTDGQELWSFRTQLEPGGPPAVNELVVLVPGRDNALWALEPSTGELLWQHEAFGEFNVTPALAGRSAFVGSSDGKLWRIDLDDGGQAWELEIGAPVTGDPVVLGSTLIVGLANGRIVALSDQGVP